MTRDGYNPRWLDEPYSWPRYTPLVLDLEEPEGECCPQCAEPLRLTGFCGACGWRGDQ